MNFRNRFRRKALIITVITVLSLVLFYAGLSLLLFEADPLLGMLDRTTDAYLLFRIQGTH
jgi:hypothetical protein